MRDRRDTIAELESQLALVLRRATNAQVQPVMRALTAGGLNVGPVREAEAMALRLRLEQLATYPAGPQWARYTREVRAIIDRLGYLGMLEMRADIEAAVRDVRPSFVVSLGDPDNMNRENALLYEFAAQGIMHEHYAANHEAMSREVLYGLAQGWDEERMGQAIHDLGFTARRAWADTWARTEATRYYNVGSLDLAETAGDLVWGYRYSVKVDDRTTPICRPLEQRVVSKANLVQVPPLHWNCRTRLFPVLDPSITGEPVEESEVLPIAAKGFGVDPRATLGLREAA